MEVARSLWRRVRALDPFVKDAALALVLGLLTIEELTGRLDLGGPPPPPAYWPALTAATVAPLAWRRRHPTIVFGVQAAAEMVTVIAYGHLGFSGVVLASIMIGAYSAGAYSRDRAASLALVLLGGIAPDFGHGLSWFIGGASPGLFPLIPLTAWLIGNSIRSHRRLVAGLKERALRLERERDATARAAVAEERAHIARELHDVVAHGVAVMVVQAEAARRVLRRRPQEAEEALRSVSATGSEALKELQHLLGVLSDDANRTEPELEPAPGLRDLDALVERVQAAGLLVELHLDGEVRPLPRGLDLTVYRIVQEALTNVLKHAATSRAEVRLRYSDDGLGIEVTDAGRPPAKSNGAGRGLVGMRQRVAAYGGELETGPRAEGGYAVRVRLPLGASS